MCTIHRFSMIVGPEAPTVAEKHSLKIGLA
jgi:hypothetical protein